MSRVDRVNHQMQKEIGTVLLSEFSDPRFQFVSITQVDVSPDLKNAKVFFSLLGDTSKVELTFNALNKAASRVRRLVAGRMRLKFMPTIEFHYDDSVDKSFKIDETLKEIEHLNEQDSSSD